MCHTRLDIFDLDGTLFRSPEDTPENKARYERHHGIPWHVNRHQAATLTKRLGRPIRARTGWWGQCETLQPPLVPDPAPKDMWRDDVVQELLASKADPLRLTTIMTGRHVGMKNAVYRVLHDGAFVTVACHPKPDGGRHFAVTDPDVSVYLLGMDGPAPTRVGRRKPTSTREWKSWLVEQLLNLHPTIDRVCFWEDRPAHADHFRSLAQTLPVDITVNLIADPI